MQLVFIKNVKNRIFLKKKSKIEIGGGYSVYGRQMKRCRRDR